MIYSLRSVTWLSKTVPGAQGRTRQAPNASHLQILFRPGVGKKYLPKAPLPFYDTKNIIVLETVFFKVS